MSELFINDAEGYIDIGSRVLRIEFGPNQISFYEQCDQYYGAELNKEEFTQLIEALKQWCDEME